MKFASTHLSIHFKLSPNLYLNNLIPSTYLFYLQVQTIIAQHFLSLKKSLFFDLWRPTNRGSRYIQARITNPYSICFTSRRKVLSGRTTSLYCFYNSNLGLTHRTYLTSWTKVLVFYWLKYTELLWYHRQVYQINYFTLCLTNYLSNFTIKAQPPRKVITFWNYLLISYIMKFPSHVILDVNRPLGFSNTTSLKWQEFYKTIFLKPNSLHTASKTSTNTYAKRIVVSRAFTHTASNNSLTNLKKTCLKKDRVTAYYVPFKDKLTQPQLDLIFKHTSSNHLRLQMPNTSKKNHWRRGLKNQLLLETSNIKSMTGEFNLYLKLSKRFLKPFLKSSMKSENDLKPGPIRTNRGKKPLKNPKFCFKNFTVNFQTSDSQRVSQQKSFFAKKNQKPQSSHLHNLFDIHFLLKEMHYSKLKYSKTAERDIVSSGSAALFAGFIGFLISEKFGIELVDSGDFYFIFMYLVFFGFSVKVFVSGLESSVEDWRPSSDPQAYTYKPHHGFAAFHNFFIYCFTMLTLFLRFLSRFSILNKLFTTLYIPLKPLFRSTKQILTPFLKNRWF